MLLLGLDFEASSTEPTTARVFEVGAVLWDTDRQCPLRLVSSLISDLDEDLPPEVEQITGVTTDDCRRYGLPKERVFKNLHALARRAEVFVAHNGHDYDFPLWDAECARLASPGQIGGFRLDTLCDIPYPTNISTRKLGHLAADHGILNPFSHRAVFDVLTMLSVLSRYPLEKVLYHAKQPVFTVVAQVTFKTNDLAKSRGYRWDAVMKRWHKSVREYQLADELTNLPFSTQLFDAQGKQVRNASPLATLR